MKNKKPLNVKNKLSISEKMESLKDNFESSRISPTSWRKKELLKEDSKTSLLANYEAPRLSFLETKKEFNDQIDAIQEKYGIKNLKLTNKITKPRKKMSILHSTLEGLLRKNIINADMFKNEKSNDFFSVKKLSSYINRLSQKKDLKIKRHKK
ncbi:unnamed protein product [Moneuplotes crassus]|uniref:Uncharacterized protein n=1 Tax=Euplotes crassus TaxID=5936 RepID=A0AAD1U8S9_EUPCR|nr:unnamed protein product [Moneuplotes crassus]